MRYVANRLWNWSQRFLHRFGVHCATHQIRLILVSGFVISSLLYPALATYFSNNPHLSVNFRSHIWDYVYSPEAYTKNDLVRVWTDHPAVQINHETLARARCGTETTLRVERALMASNNFDETGALNKQTLSSALRVETAIAESLTSRNARCVTPGCIPISVLSYWNNDEYLLSQEMDILHTINTRKNAAVGGFPITAAMVLAGLESGERDGHPIVFAHFLSSSYLFHEDDCSGSGGHNLWLKTLEDTVSPLVDLKVKKQSPLLLALELDPEMKRSHHFFGVTTLFFLSYIVLFIYLSGSMRRMDTVHSRIGLCFTGLVEIVSSTVTSLSVCALAGLRITMVPWSVFPIVIVFVGAENMFRLVDEVVKTPITLPVKERIGQGLVRAGTSNTLKVVSYNAIIGVIGFFAQGAIRQFCIFSIVVLVAHWFLIHTFFVAVLSIDIARLELNDLIRQGSSAPPLLQDPLIAKRKPSDCKSQVKPSSSSVLGSSTVSKLRVSRNFSLLLVLMLTGALYYSTLPTASKPTNVKRPWAERTRLKADIPSDPHSQVRHMWDILNPEGDSFIHLRIEPPAVMTLSAPDDDQYAARYSSSQRSRWSTQTFRPLIWTVRYMVLPMGITLSCLYLLLRYLLKGTDRLEDNRTVERINGKDKVPIKEHISFKTFPRIFASDVSLLYSDDECHITVTVSADEEVYAWFGTHDTYVYVDTTVLLQSAARSKANGVPCISQLTVSRNGGHFGLGTSDGIIGVWRTHDEDVSFVGTLRSDRSNGSVSFMEFALDTADNPPVIIACYENASAMRWSVEDRIPVSIQAPSQRRPSKAEIIRKDTGHAPMVCLTMQDGHVELFEPSSIAEECRPTYIIPPGEYSNLLDLQTIPIEGSPHVICALATTNGLIILYDLTDNERVAEIDEVFESVAKLRIIPLPAKPCPKCSEVPSCAFLVAYQVGHVIFMDQGRLMQKCTCPTKQTLTSASVSHRELKSGRRSRSNSFVNSSGGEVFLRPKNRVPSFSNGFPTGPSSSFPVSGHGMHSRRASDKDPRRHSDRADKSSTHFADGNAQEMSNSLHVNGSHLSSSPAGPYNSDRWRNFKLVRASEATCERAGWDVVGSRIVGIRRMPRSRSSGTENSKNKSAATTSLAIPPSMLDRWELWMVELSKLDRPSQASYLSDFHSPVSLSVGERQLPQLSFTRLSNMTVFGSRLHFGLGNAVGIVELPQDILKTK